MASEVEFDSAFLDDLEHELEIEDKKEEGNWYFYYFMFFLFTMITVIMITCFVF